MAEIIPIRQTTIENEQVQTVDARKLHEYLGVGKMFTHWIKDRIEKYQFQEGMDYVLTIAKTGKRQNVVVYEYHLTFDMAKELAMVEKNEKGREARRYFIECEKKAKEALNSQTIPDFSDPVLAARAWADEQEQKRAAIQQLEHAKGDLAILDRIAKSDGSMCITDAAKHLQIRPKDLFSYMRENKWIYRRTGCRHDVGYQARIQQGFLEHKVTSVARTDGSEKIVEQVRVTPRGLSKLANLFNIDLKRAA